MLARNGLGFVFNQPWTTFSAWVGPAGAADARGQIMRSAHTAAKGRIAILWICSAR
jgi:hypothetical protein